jgi:hypothetical protein
MQKERNTAKRAAKAESVLQEIHPTEAPEKKTA